MNKKPMYVEIPEKTLIATKKLSKKLGLPLNKIVDFALKELINGKPKINIEYKTDENSSK